MRACVRCAAHPFRSTQAKATEGRRRRGTASPVNRDTGSRRWPGRKRPATAKPDARTGRAQVCDDALAERGDDIGARCAGERQHGHDRDHHADAVGVEIEVDHAPHERCCCGPARFGTEAVPGIVMSARRSSTRSAVLICLSPCCAKEVVIHRSFSLEWRCYSRNDVDRNQIFRAENRLLFLCSFPSTEMKDEC